MDTVSKCKSRAAKNISTNFIRNRISTLKNEVSKCLAKVPIPVEDIDLHKRCELLHLDKICEYCRKERASTLDHFNPLIRDGQPTPFCTDIWNSVPCCPTCNSSKGNRNAVEWLSGTATRNPCGNLDENSRSEIIRKWEEYALACQKNCIKKRVDDAWFSVVDKILWSVLDTFQSHIDVFRNDYEFEESKRLVKYGKPERDYHSDLLGDLRTKLSDLYVEFNILKTEKLSLDGVSPQH